MIISAHCVLNKLSLKKHIKDLEKFIAVFGNQIPYYYGKRITKRYIWSHFTKKRTINMYSDFEKRYFFHNAISFFKSTTLKKILSLRFLQVKRIDIGSINKLKKIKIFFTTLKWKFLIIILPMEILGRVLDSQNISHKEKYY